MGAVSHAIQDGIGHDGLRKNSKPTIDGSKALCHQACRNHFTVAFYSFHQFFNELQKAEVKNQLTKLMKNLIKIHLLTIDDFAFKKIDQQASEYLYAIVDARYAVKSTILTSNRLWP